jgi:hypothetical protein
VTKTFSAKKGDEDLNFSETMYKARIDAIGEALAQIAGEFVEFIEISMEKSE